MASLKAYIAAYAPMIILMIIFFFVIRNEVRTAATVRTVTKDSAIVILKDTALHSSVATDLQPVNNTYITNHYPVVDTAKLIHDYFTKHFYTTVTGDSLIQITTADSVYKNGITNKKTTWHFLKPYQVQKTYTVTVTDTKEIVKTNGLFLGVFASVNPKNKTLTGYGPEANFIFNRNNIGLGYDVVNNAAQIKFLYKIGKK